MFHTVSNFRRTSSLLIVTILALQLVLISEHLKPVSGSKLKSLRRIAALLMMLKKKKPKIGVIPIPLPLPLPMKVEQHEPPIYIHKKKYPVTIHHNVPIHEPYPQPYPVVEPPSYVDGGYAAPHGDGGYGNGGGGYPAPTYAQGIGGDSYGGAPGYGGGQYMGGGGSYGGGMGDGY